MPTTGQNVHGYNATVSASTSFKIGSRVIGASRRPFVIAEVSANHGGSLENALEIITAAAGCGADAVKLQHYRPETITIRSELPEFQVGGGTLWDGRQLFDLYQEAMTPWEWTGPLLDRARELGLICFSSPFDFSAVDFLETFGVEAYKVASFELVDLPLIRYVAATGKPMIMSTGMASLEEIDAAVEAARSAGCTSLSLLRCNSGYPAEPSEMDLAAIPFMRARYECEIGLSDHTLDSTASVAAVALGATIIEKHITLRRSDGGPDSGFSSEPTELAALIRQVEVAWQAIGNPRFGPSTREVASKAFRRSLRVTRDLQAGDVLTGDNVRSVRPAGGLPPDEIARVIGRTLVRPLTVGAALSWEDIEGGLADR